MVWLRHADEYGPKTLHNREENAKICPLVSELFGPTVLSRQAGESRVLAALHCSQTPGQVISLLNAFKEEPGSENTCGRVGLAPRGDWLETTCSLKAGKRNISSF